MQQLSEATIGGSAATCAGALLDGVPAVMWFIRKHMRRHRSGLSVPQFRMLVWAERFPQGSLSAAADHVGCSLPSASRMISGLVAKGLVERKESAEDRRQVSLALTSRGASMLKGARAAAQELMAQAVAPLDEGQQGAIVEAMRLLQGLFTEGTYVDR